MEGVNSNMICRLSDNGAEAFAHIPRGIIGERETQNITWRYIILPQNISDPHAEQLRLSRSRSGHNQQRTFGCIDRLPLSLI
jgi:hypothetical protein